MLRDHGETEYAFDLVLGSGVRRLDSGTGPVARRLLVLRHGPSEILGPAIDAFDDVGLVLRPQLLVVLDVLDA